MSANSNSGFIPTALFFNTLVENKYFFGRPKPSFLLHADEERSGLNGYSEGEIYI